MRMTLITLALLCIGGTASATEEILTASGTISFSYDPSNEGKSYIATIEYNTDYIYEVENSPGTTRYDFDGADGLALVSLSLNGSTILSSSGRGNVTSSFPPSYGGDSLYAEAYVGSNYDIGFSVNFLSSIVDLNGTYSYAGSSRSGFAFNEYSPRAYLYGSVDAVTLTQSADLPPATVPEPSAWLMLLIGLGVAGAELRGRRRAIKLMMIQRSPFGRAPNA